MRIQQLLAATAFGCAAFAPAAGQGLDLTVNNAGIAIGNKPRVTGLRFNYRDRGLDKVVGLNVTLWTPYDASSGPVNRDNPFGSGTVEGIALGLPLTGAANIRGIGAGLFGFGVGESITGIGIAPLGFGAGNSASGLMLAGAGFGVGNSFTGLGVAGLGAGIGTSMHGILIAGLGAGVGAEATGIIVGGLGAGVGSEFHGIGVGGMGFGIGNGMRGAAVGGLGIGVGSDMHGIAIGGVGVGVGKSGRGLALGGIGVGVGNDFRGIGFGGVGLGAGGDVTGIVIGGVGVGIGHDLRGLAIGGAGVGAGGTIHGIALAIGGVGAQRIEGFTASLGAGARTAHAIVIAPIYFKIEGTDGEFRGASLSAWNRNQGTQRGLTIGLLNTARELHGVQIGLINISENGGRKLVLPLIAARH